MEELMKIFNISYKTIYNWMNRWESEGIVGLYNKPGRGRKRIFKPEQESKIREWAQQEPRQLKKTLQKVKEEWVVHQINVGWYGERAIFNLKQLYGLSSVWSR